MAQPDRSEELAGLIVSLDELASICGITPETMRKHLKGAPEDADWLVERGRRGVGYQIEAAGAVAWWKSRNGDGGEDDARQAALNEWRLQALGDLADEEGAGLSGKIRYEEFRAAKSELEYRLLIGELCRAAEFEDHTVNAVIELRRQLQAVGPAIRREFGLGREIAEAIETKIGERVAAFVKKLGTGGEPDAPA